MLAISALIYWEVFGGLDYRFFDKTGELDVSPPADVILNGRPRSGRERRIQSDMCREATLLKDGPLILLYVM